MVKQTSVAVSRAHNCFSWRRQRRGIAFCRWPINGVINGANFTWTLRIITSHSPSPPSSCLYGSQSGECVCFTNESPAGTQRTVEGKATDDKSSGTAAWRTEMRSAAAAESAAAAHAAVTFFHSVHRWQCVDLSHYPAYLSHNDILSAWPSMEISTNNENMKEKQAKLFSAD